MVKWVESFLKHITVNQMTRGVNKIIINYMTKNKETNFLNKFDNNLILFDGDSNKSIGYWKKTINGKL
jgi:hypothetical protein